MIRIDIDDVADLLARVARGQLTATTSHDGVLWTVDADGYVIELFDDAGKIDYVERVTDPAGRTVVFDQYWNAHGCDPVGRLAPEHCQKLSDMMFSDYVHRNIPPRRR